MKENEKAFERGRYAVMSYFVSKVEELTSNPAMFQSLDLNKEIIDLFLGIYINDLKALEWIKKEKEELDKILNNS